MLIDWGAIQFLPESHPFGKHKLVQTHEASGRTVSRRLYHLLPPSLYHSMTLWPYDSMTLWSYDSITLSLYHSILSLPTFTPLISHPFVSASWWIGLRTCTSPTTHTKSTNSLLKKDKPKSKNYWITPVNQSMHYLSNGRKPEIWLYGITPVSCKSPFHYHTSHLHITFLSLILQYIYEAYYTMVLVCIDTTRHRVTQGAFEGKYKRDMRRTTVHDGSSQAWGLNQVGDTWRSGLPWVCNAYEYTGTIDILLPRTSTQNVLRVNIVAFVVIRGL